MRLPAGRKVDRCEDTLRREHQARHMNLRQMNIHNLSAANAANLHAVNNWQLKLRRQHAIDTACYSPSIHQGLHVSYSRSRYLNLVFWPVARIETYIHKKGRSPSHQQLAARDRTCFLKTGSW